LDFLKYVIYALLRKMYIIILPSSEALLVRPGPYQKLRVKETMAAFNL
jgi:hypothetical protein